MGYPNNTTEYAAIYEDELAAMASAAEHGHLGLEDPIAVLATVAIAGGLGFGLGVDEVASCEDLRAVILALTENPEILDRAAEKLPQALLDTNHLSGWLRVQEVHEMTEAAGLVSARGHGNVLIEQMVLTAQMGAVEEVDVEGIAWALTALEAAGMDSPGTEFLKQFKV